MHSYFPAWDYAYANVCVRIQIIKDFLYTYMYVCIYMFVYVLFNVCGMVKSMSVYLIIKWIQKLLVVVPNEYIKFNYNLTDVSWLIYNV